MRALLAGSYMKGNWQKQKSYLRGCTASTTAGKEYGYGWQDQHNGSTGRNKLSQVAARAPL